MTRKRKATILGFRIWRCSACRHIVPRDYLDYFQPPTCRGKPNCLGTYMKDAIFAPVFDEERVSRETGREADMRMLRSSNIHRQQLVKCENREAEMARLARAIKVANR